MGGGGMGGMGGGGMGGMGGGGMGGGMGGGLEEVPVLGAVFIGIC